MVYVLHYAITFYKLFYAPEFLYGDLTLKVGHLYFLVGALKFDLDIVI